MRRRPAPTPALLLAAVLLASCGGDPAGRGRTGEPEGLLLSGGASPVADGEVPEPVISRSVYVPIYSHIYLDDPEQAYPLASTLSIRNTDPDRPLFLASIRYIDTDGSEVRDYLSRTLRLAPLATAEVVVRERDLSGGSGANFVVDWAADGPVSRPVVQSVMIGSAGNQGISFVCEGSEIVRLPADPAPR
ncbi:DUF3124 domain-containing protein [Tautonia plasticadhaerens]|uniref:DUF3124 domain-containing protein n=1 Tax=Tautonia plasticadhaerens TaxID=2527974 RepID=A0A518H4Y5_9BACT|nr:DUF3124 domain-containing protein [Tautonia plasticadhaerens]QDV35910.1 hypothetical protein ElP_38180 [Tautonia plasticadhaerens]